MRAFMHLFVVFLIAQDEEKALVANRVGGVNVTNGQRKTSNESCRDFVYPRTDHLTKITTDLEHDRG